MSQSFEQGASFSMSDSRFWKASGARGNARYQLMLNPPEKPRRPPLSERLKNSKYITKDVKWKPEQTLSDRTPTGLNDQFCKACRNLAECKSRQAINVLAIDNNGVNFEHLDMNFLQLSVKRGCPLCTILWQGLRPAWVRLGNGEEMPLQYDFGRYLTGTENPDVHAVRFYPYTLVESPKHEMMPMLMPVLKVTFEKNSVENKNKRSKAETGLCMEQTQGGPSSVLAGSTGSTSSSTRVAEWIALCDQNHTQCSQRRSKHSGFTPHRLIDVGTEGSNIKLVMGADLSSETKYATLSHCWGKLAPTTSSKLTKTNLKTFLSGVRLEDLPKTFADACRICRSLGIKYVWIDSLCIIQDSKEDLQRDLAIMWKIYTTSYLNLSATASSNFSQGLFRDREKSTVDNCIVRIADDHPQIPKGEYLCYNESEWQMMVDYAPVNVRAWVFQERMLSPRVLHFSQNQLFWECMELRASECFGNGLPERYDCSDLREDINRALNDRSLSTLLHIWHRIISKYSGLDLSFESDKLVALSAIVDQLRDTFNRTYVAGLWQSDFIGQLCWIASQHTFKAKSYRAPSWSWASLEGQIYPNFNQIDSYDPGSPIRTKPMLTVSDTSTDTDSSNAFLVTGARLSITCALIPVEIMKPKAADDSRSSAEQSTEQATANLVKTMSQVIPGYTGEGLMSIGVSDGPLPTGFDGSGLMQMDPKHGVMSTDGRQPQKLGEPEQHLKRTERHFQMKFDDIHECDVFLDEDLDRTKLDLSILFFMPVFCEFDCSMTDAENSFEIDVIQGLALSKVVDAEDVFHRVGMGQVDEYGAMEFFCQLERSESEASLPLDTSLVSDRRLLLEDFVPPRWTGKTLDFMPTSFRLYNIQLI